MGRMRKDGVVYSGQCYSCNSQVVKDNGICAMCGADCTKASRSAQRTEVCNQVFSAFQFGTEEEQERARARLKRFDGE